MPSIATVTTAPEVTALTTLERVKAELSITVDTNDEILGWKIDEASSDIEAHLARTLSRATISERFWGPPWNSEYLVLNRNPVASITSVTVDDELVDASEYRLDPETGILYRLDASGYPCFWMWCKDIVVVYAAGYLMPGESDRNLPAVLESAAVDLVNSYWQSRGRDSTIKSESAPGLMEVSYWVGAVGESGSLPPSVVSKISPFRRPSL